MKQQNRKSKSIRHKQKIYNMPLCCDVQLSIICKVCGYFLSTLYSASHYVNIDIPHYRFGNHFLVLQNFQYSNLRIDHENQIFNTEQPFLMMFFKKVYCGYCGDNCIGLYFETVNILDTQWLLQRFAINMEEVALQEIRSPLMESTINQLYSLLNSLETEKKRRKHVQKTEVKKRNFEKDKVNSIIYEKKLEKFIKDNIYRGFQQNCRKNQVSTRILEALSFFDRRTERFEKQFKLVLRNAENLRKKIISKYSTIQSFKAFVSKRENEKSGQPR